MLKLGEVCQLPSEGKAKAYSTWYSQAVSHPSTNQARPCLFRDQTRSGVQGGMAVSEYNAQEQAI